MPRKMISVCFSCLDEQSRFTGYAEAAGALSLDICCQVVGKGARFTVDEKAMTFMLHRRRYHFRTLGIGYGNSFWARFGMRRAEARRLLRDMAKSGHWDCQGGLVRMCAWWEKHEGAKV